VRILIDARQLRRGQRHPPNADTVGDAGIYFSGREGVGSLSAQLSLLLTAIYEAARPGSLPDSLLESGAAFANVPAPRPPDVALGLPGPAG
jgi:hypothetical protein